MCGRLNVIAAPLCQWVSETLGIDFATSDNLDLRPTQSVTTLTETDGVCRQQRASWGIKPSWAKHILINAQAESVEQKPTFKSAFSRNRCLVPVSGWYEWRQEDTGKVRYLFSDAGGEPLLMAGLLFYEGDEAKLVTLTTQPTPDCLQYHHRMPLFVSAANVGFWFGSTTEQLVPLLQNDQQMAVQISRSCL